MNIKELERRIKRLQEDCVECGLSPIDDILALISETNGIEMTQENYAELLWSDHMIEGMRK
jgi:hypothetical protein